MSRAGRGGSQAAAPRTQRVHLQYVAVQPKQLHAREHTTASSAHARSQRAGSPPLYTSLLWHSSGPSFAGQRSVRLPGARVSGQQPGLRSDAAPQPARSPGLTQQTTRGNAGVFPHREDDFDFRGRFPKAGILARNLRRRGQTTNCRLRPDFVRWNRRNEQHQARLIGKPQIPRIPPNFQKFGPRKFGRRLPILRTPLGDRMIP